MTTPLLASFLERLHVVVSFLSMTKQESKRKTKQRPGFSRFQRRHGRTANEQHDPLRIPSYVSETTLSANPIQRLQDKEPSFYERNQDHTYSETRNEIDSSRLATLPTSIQVEVMSYLYDDMESLSSLCQSHPKSVISMEDPAVRTYMAHCIRRNSPNETDPFCRICSNPLCYPYQLTGSCDHFVCGRCVWVCRQQLRPCGCGCKIRSRPQRRDGTLANSRAYWLLTPHGKQYYIHFKKKTKKIQPKLSHPYFCVAMVCFLLL